MRQAITTKYFGPTDTKGARVYARAQAGGLSFPWDHSLDADENHAAAARAYAEVHSWKGRMYGGALPSGGYAFVFDDSPVEATRGRPKSIDEREVKTLREAGASNREIARKLGVTHGAVNMVVKRFGL